MLPITPAKATHDYVRNGTIDLFAALEVATGKVITDLRPSHTSAEFVKLLDKIDIEVPTGLDVHVVLDNLSTHKTPAVHEWLLRHPASHFRFTPTYGSWMNLVERWFSALHQEAPALRAPQRQCPRCRHPRVGRDLERGPQALHLAQERRRDPPASRRLLPSDQQIAEASVGQDTSQNRSVLRRPLESADPRPRLFVSGVGHTTMRAIVDSVATRSPALTVSDSIVPSMPAVIGICIFIASTTNSTWPATTSSPSDT